MTIKTKPLDIRLTLYNGGTLRIWEDNPNFDAEYQIKKLDELIPMHQKYLNSSSSKNFSIDELRIQLLELNEARQKLIELVEEVREEN